MVHRDSRPGPLILQCRNFRCPVIYHHLGVMAPAAVIGHAEQGIDLSSFTGNSFIMGSRFFRPSEELGAFPYHPGSV
jgi:hypothetical protein